MTEELRHARNENKEEDNNKGMNAIKKDAKDTMNEWKKKRIMTRKKTF